MKVPIHWVLTSEKNVYTLLSRAEKLQRFEDSIFNVTMLPKINLNGFFRVFKLQIL